MTAETTTTTPASWKGATLKEQERMMAEALHVAGTVEKAAKMLGISRRHLTRVRSSMRRGTPRLIETNETSRLTETEETAEPSRLVHATETRRGSETATPTNALTYGHHAPTLHPMSTAVAPTTDATREADPVSRVAFDLPKSLTDWLDEKALRRKQERGESRPSKSRIVAELIARARAEDARPREVAPPSKAGRKR